jgi:hypothetical protein
MCVQELELCEVQQQYDALIGGVAAVAERLSVSTQHVAPSEQVCTYTTHTTAIHTCIQVPGHFCI